MTTINEQCYVELENLVKELMASEKVYGTLAQSDRYPKKRPYFQKRRVKQQRFAQISNDEFFVIKGQNPVEPEKSDTSIFNSLERKLSGDTLTEKEVDLLIMEKEQDLIVLYQRVLAHKGLPGTTEALLQSQVEELNGSLYGLRLDYHINSITKPAYV